MNICWLKATTTKKTQLNINVYFSFQEREQNVAQPGKSWGSCFFAPAALRGGEWVGLGGARGRKAGMQMLLRAQRSWAVFRAE